MVSKASDDLPEPLTPVIDDQLVGRERDVDVLEVVRPRAAHHDGVALPDGVWKGLVHRL